MTDETRRSHSPIDDIMFDRLVDGEMNEAERRELLLSLDADPDGWRRLSIAFLEAQMLQEAMELPMPAIEEDLAAPSPAAVDESLPAAAEEDTTAVEIENDESDHPRPFHRSLRNRWAHRAQTLAAMAASFLVALGIGSYWNDRGLPVPGADEPAGVTAPDLPGATQSDMTATAVPAGYTQSGNDPWRVVEMSGPVGPDGEEQTLYLPAIERPAIDEDWVQSLPKAVPDDVRQSLYRTGHQVSEQRELVPIMTNDGRRVVVPVDKVNVRYVGRDSL